MSLSVWKPAGLRSVLKFPKFCRFGRDDKGATVVEFAIVATPFLMFIFALFASSLFFFILSSVEKGMDQSARLIRTGQAASQGMTVADFKNSICDGAGRSWIDCNKMQVWAQHWSDWSDPTLAPHQCVDQNNTVIVNTAAAGDKIATYTGTASDVVVVTTCYQWDFANKIPYFNYLANMQSGAMMMQTATAFRSEPYNGPGS